jgi:hypothetical protein
MFPVLFVVQKAHRHRADIALAWGAREEEGWAQAMPDPPDRAYLSQATKGLPSS